MKSKSQTKVSHNNRKFDGLIVKEKNKNDYTKIDKQICFAILPKNNYIQIKKNDEIEALLEKSRAEKKERFKYYEELFKKHDEDLNNKTKTRRKYEKTKRNSFAKNKKYGKLLQKRK